MPCDTTKASSDIEHVDWSTGTGSGHHYSNVRFGSGSSQASQSSGDICRICHCESDPQNPLLTPCYCAGSLKYVHQTCLQQWLTASETNSCELCKFPFIMHTKIKPFNEWRSLDISSIEKRRLCCSVLFHCAAALCVIWSLCVLIERAADDVQRGLIDWPLWTKLAVVTVGLTGGVVFVYIQCKAYLHLCHRWKARNRILLIQNAPEKVHPLSPPSPMRNQRGRNASEQRATTVNMASGSLEVAANVAVGASNAYNYVNAPSIVTGGLDGGNGTAAALHHIHHLPASPRRLQCQNELDIDQLGPGSSSSLQQHQTHQIVMPHHQMSQVAVAANIECPQAQNYERDWALDDVVSQISSFRPCPQGSGSMTPFHDSVHNVLEHSTGSSRASVNDVCGGSRQDLSTDGVSTDTGRSGDHKVPSISSGVSHAVANGLGGFVYKPHHTKRYSNSSIFLENHHVMLDANDASDLGEVCDYPKMNYRHSSILANSGSSSEEQFEKFLGEDLHRYSDAKLLTDVVADAEVNEPMMSVIDAEAQNSEQRKTLAATVLDMELLASPLSPPFDNWSDQRPTLRRSMHTVDVVDAAYNCDLPGAVMHMHEHAHANSAASTQQIEKARLFYKSLPNLSSSCESLIKK